MSLVILRAAAPIFDVASFVVEHQVTYESAWQAGEPDRLGRIQAASGFNVLVAETSVASGLADACVRWLQAQRAMLGALVAAGTAPRLNVGVFVGEGQPAASVLLSEELLSLCVHIGVAVEFSAYAAHDPTRAV